MARNYSDEEVEAIFRRALERQLEDEDGFAHDELIAAAKEVGLSQGAVDRAVLEIESERSEESIRESLVRKKRERWLRHFVTYLVIAGGFLGMHVLGYVGVWAIWLAFGWGMGLALDTFGVLRGPSEEDVEKERKKLNRKARRAAQAKARREAKRRKAEERARRRQRRRQTRGAGDESQRVVEEGVALLLSAAARKLREATGELEKPPKTEFERYVADRKRHERGAVVTPAPDAKPKERSRAAGVRVELDEDEDELAEEEELARRRRRGRR